MIGLNVSLLQTQLAVQRYWKTLSSRDLDMAFSKSLTPSVTATGSRSTFCSRSTIKQREAYAIMKLLELRAAREEKRAQEDVEHKRRETRRKLDLVALKLKLYRIMIFAITNFQ